jgi:hypothetical protein
MADLKPKSYDAMFARVNAFRKAASHTPPEKDPADKGTREIPKDPDVTDAKLNLPTNRTPIGPAKEQLTDKDLKPAPFNENVPSTVGGDAKDKSVSSPTDPLSKIAKTASEIATRIKAMRGEPVKVAAAPAPVATNDTVAADIQLTPEFHFKLAAEILSTEEGIAFAEKTLTKRAGQVAAHEMVKSALAAQRQFIELANQQDELQKQAVEHSNVIEGIFKSASAEDKAQMTKIATVHQQVLATITDPEEQLAYMEGCKDAAAMMDSDAQGGGQPGQPDPAAGPEIPGGGQGPQTLEEVAQLLSQMVESKEIDPQTAQAVMKELAQAEQGGGAGGPPAPGGAGDAEGAPGGGAPGAPGGDAAGGGPGAAAPAELSGDAEPQGPDAKAASVLFRDLAHLFQVAA